MSKSNPWFLSFSQERDGQPVCESRRSDEAVAKQDARLIHFVSGRRTWTEAEHTANESVVRAAPQAVYRESFDGGDGASGSSPST